MKIAPKGSFASRLRQRKFALLRQFPIPDDLLPGSLVLDSTPCGKPSCHCAKGTAHAPWSLGLMDRGKRHGQRIPKEWVEEVKKQVDAGRKFQDAVREVLAASAQLLALARKQRHR